MANWWDAAPLATKAATPAAAGNWWESAPLAQERSAPTIEPGKEGGPKRLVMDLSEKPDRGTLDATARGAAQGFTANFGDELRGLVEASGANPDDPASLTKLISGALKYWTGDADAKKRYEDAVKRERDLNKSAETQHPYASLAGNVAGAVALPIGAGAGAATLGGRMLAGAGTGAALGGAAPAVIEGAVRGARAVATPVANAIRGVRDVDSEAARRVVTALERDIGADPQAANRLTPGEFAASVQSGGPATLMDIGGDTTRALARSAANTSPEGRAALNRTINDRFEGQGGRVTDWLRHTFHFPDAQAQQDALEQTARTVNRANYARSMREGDREIFSPELDRLMGSPAVVDAMRRASVSGKDREIGR